ncbi:uncharacterized protein N0V89_010228 [Didymosphaeria variabile]|uniref:Uncharacterized protein n=1 Tax=Didymosphaeria variabile TaxID=1932322 RepID=A0A9W8XGN0_9PLEO|nr:uncharacterized protein N0V89_010228 [Didymosphaeria variabile]KAJ4348849.1 hypothetical protein N0V89_010228 [Didymosphaeria variabile]
MSLYDAKMETREDDPKKYTLQDPDFLALEVKFAQLELSTVKRDLASKTEEIGSITAQLTASKAELEVFKKKALEHITPVADASELAAVKADLAAVKSELDTLKKEKKEMGIKHSRTVSKKNGEIAALKKGLAAQQMNHQAAVSAQFDAAQAYHQLAQYQSAWEQAQQTNAGLEAKTSSLHSTLDRASEDLRTVRHELSAAQADATVAAQDLASERAAGAERKRELAAAQLALEEARSSLAAAADKTCGDCATLERQLRHARAGADSALQQLDEVHYKCMSTWSVLHDITWDVEAKLSMRSGTPELIDSSGSNESDGSVEIVGGDGEALVFDKNTPPHLRRARVLVRK